MFSNLGTPQWITLALLGAAAVVLLVGLVALCVGLFQARSLVRREFAAYFLSPIGYVVLVVFLAVTGHLFAVTLGLLTTTGPKGTDSPMQTMFADERFWLVFLFIPPLLTMRLFAEERSSGTLEMLMTAPLRDWQVVLAKYLACLAFYVVIWLPTLIYLPALLGAEAPVWHLNWVGFHLPGTQATTILVPLPQTAWAWVLVGGLAAMLVGLGLLLPRLGTRARLGSLVLIVVGAATAAAGGYLNYTRDAEHLLEIPIRLDNAPVLATYLGMFLAGAMFLALGLLISSLVRDQMVSAIIALALGLVFIAAGFWRPERDGSLGSQLVYFFSVPLHFHDTFTRGRIDTRPLVLYASTAVFCLFLTVRSLESRRWQ
jgi:ABC-type transport system involved in multi-copper enzyme maturation permease subunit